MANNRVQVLATQNSPIPENGFVAGGYGNGFIWIVVQMKPGVSVFYDDSRIYIPEIPLAEQTTTEQLTQLLVTVLEILQNPTQTEAHEQARPLLEQILLWRSQETPPTTEQLSAMREQLDLLSR